MRCLDLFLMGVKNLWRRKTSTLLTVLGVIIGTTAIIVMLSLGFGMEKARNEELEKIGGLTTIEVYKPWVNEDPNRKEEGQTVLYLDEQTVADFKNIKNVTGVLATKQTQISLAIGKKQSWSQVLAVDFNELQAFGYKLESGEWPELTDNNGIVAGASTGMNFYDPTSFNYEEPEPIDLLTSIVKCYVEGEYYGQGQKKRPFSVDITGVLASKEDWMDHTSYISFYAYEQLKKQNDRKYGERQRERIKPGTRVDIYDSMKVKVNKFENVLDVQDQIKALGFEAYSNAEWLGNEQNQAKIIQGVLGGIGGVSLLIAAIGITNTMIMSIYERTREIGVMKVLGAKLKDIKNLFLIEAALIGLLGGVIGIGFSIAGSKVINHIVSNSEGMEMMVSGEISYIPPYLLLVALVFSTLVGIVSGYYPARRAMKLSALKAISTN